MTVDDLVLAAVLGQWEAALGLVRVGEELRQPAAVPALARRLGLAAVVGGVLCRFTSEVFQLAAAEAEPVGDRRPGLWRFGQLLFQREDRREVGIGQVEFLTRSSMLDQPTQRLLCPDLQHRRDKWLEQRGPVDWADSPDLLASLFVEALNCLNYPLS